MEEEGGPAHDEDAQQHGQGDGPLHASLLPHGVVPGQGGDAPDVGLSQEEHVGVQRCHEEQHGEEHGNEADNHVRGLVVHDEDRAAAGAEGPDASDDGPRAPPRHDALVAQGVEDGDIAVHSDRQQATHGGHHGDADHGVEHVVQVPHRGISHHQMLVGEQVDGDGLPGIGQAHQHVGHRQTAHEEVHGGVQVPVPHDGPDDQDVLQQADEAQGQEHLHCDAHVLTW